jgi:hypothetical protein
MWDMSDQLQHARFPGIKRYIGKPTWGQGGWPVTWHQGHHQMNTEPLCSLISLTTNPQQVLCIETPPSSSSRSTQCSGITDRAMLVPLPQKYHTWGTETLHQSFSFLKEAKHLYISMDIWSSLNVNYLSCFSMGQISSSLLCPSRTEFSISGITEPVLY